jgi:CRISPR/Cas system CSM-associated protein Csm3 (group 7 of RAMP superfamily)
VSGGYRSVFVGNLVQDTAMCVGGRPTGGRGTRPFARDGSGCLTLPGPVLTAALLETAAQIVEELPEGVARGGWRAFTSHPNDPATTTAMRAGMAIRHDTGAGAPESGRRLEVTPRGTRWTLCVEVDTSGPQGALAEQIAMLALRAWGRGRCRLGAGRGRGLGWLHLARLRMHRLRVEDLEAWPDSRRPLAKVLRYLDENQSVRTLPARELVDALGLPQAPRAGWSFVDVDGTLELGPSDWGLDALSVGDVGNCAPTDGLGKEFRNSEAGMALSPDPRSGRWRPYIPGSTLRGALRHALARLLRAEGRSVADPATDPGSAESDELFDALFGRRERPGALQLGEAHLVGRAWQASLLHRQAQDEFAGGPLGALRPVAAIIEGSFAFRGTIEAETPARAQELADLFARLLPLGRARHIPVGGQAWGGLGRPKWTMTLSGPEGAGADPPQPPDAADTAGTEAAASHDAGSAAEESP